VTRIHVESRKKKGYQEELRLPTSSLLLSMVSHSRLLWIKIILYRYKRVHNTEWTFRRLLNKHSEYYILPIITLKILSLSRRGGRQGEREGEKLYLPCPPATSAIGRNIF
jgi:hypothetical protein